MSLINKVVYYLNDVLVSLDIAPTQKPEAKPKNIKDKPVKKTDINV